jgi:hypothetical protein
VATTPARAAPETDKIAIVIGHLLGTVDPSVDDARCIGTSDPSP